MLTNQQLNDWLERANERYRQRDLPPRQRPFRAISDLSKEFKISIDFGSDVAGKIFDWFTNHTQAGSHAIGSLFTGAYYFDACFWPVSIQVGFGTFVPKALDALETMPKMLKNQLCADRSEVRNYTSYWADCVDYAYGSDALQTRRSLSSYAAGLLQGGQGEIEGTVAQLCSARPNPKAIMSARMAAEIHLKLLLVAKGGKDAAFLRSIGHDLQKTIDACLSVAAVKEFAIIRPMLAIFPDVSARYVGTEKPMREIWEAYCIAQATAATVMRVLSGDDRRLQIIQADQRGG
jgi:hypothetical protein